MDDTRSAQPQDDEAEVEGHRRRFHATDQPQPGDEADVEGHARMIKSGRAKPEADQEPETEGHALRR